MVVEQKNRSTIDREARHRGESIPRENVTKDVKHFSPVPEDGAGRVAYFPQLSCFWQCGSGKDTDLPERNKCVHRRKILIFSGLCCPLCGLVS